MTEEPRPPKPKKPSFDVVIAARLEHAMIQTAELRQDIADLALNVERLEAVVGQVRGLLDQLTPPPPPPPPAVPRLLSGRWPLRAGDGYPRSPPQQTTEYESWVRRSPPAMD